MSEQDFDKLLDDGVDELPREIKPPQELWAGIERTIDSRANNKKRRSSLLLQAASVAACVIGAAWLFSENFDSYNPVSSEVSLAMIVDDIDEGFKKQKATALAVYEGQLALTSTWQDQLRELEVARSGIWEAIKKDPGNAYMIEMLLEVQQQQLDLIKNVHVRSNRDV